ncbi:MAG: AzlC family ABC transporter permease [Anaerovoracaceae bacterium]|nr:AzlC family ABC transporter permease [Anaerovoracaceae bacterium]
MFNYSFKKSIPIMTGYLFIGLAFGILLNSQGFNFLWAAAMALFVYAGSAQFVIVTLMMNKTALPVAALMVFLVNSRHMFYGISFIQRFKSMGKKYWYMIYTLTDETYSVLCQIKDDNRITSQEKNRGMFLVSMLNQIYWVTGCTVGALLGEFLPFSTAGIEFSMTALFVVIFVEQWITWKEKGTHIPAITGIVSAIICLLIFGPDKFILPSIIFTIGILLSFEKKIELKEMDNE